MGSADYFIKYYPFRDGSGCCTRFGIKDGFEGRTNVGPSLIDRAWSFTLPSERYATIVKNTMDVDEEFNVERV